MMFRFDGEKVVIKTKFDGIEISKEYLKQLMREYGEYGHVEVKEHGTEIDYLIDTMFYFSLVELPDGKHVPLPILLQDENYRDKVINVPISDTVRGRKFFKTGFYDTYDEEEVREEFHNKEKQVKELLDREEYNKLKIILANPVDALVAVNQKWFNKCFVNR